MGKVRCLSRRYSIIIACLSSRSKTAIKWRVMVRNPADAVEAPRPDRHEMRALNEHETMMLLDAASSKGYAPLCPFAGNGNDRSGRGGPQAGRRVA